MIAAGSLPRGRPSSWPLARPTRSRARLRSSLRSARAPGWSPTSPTRRGHGPSQRMWRPNTAGRCARQQRRSHLGRATGGARHGLVGPGAQPQRAGRLPHHQVLPAAPRGGGSARRPARVINIGSIDGIHVPALESYSYSASKAAVHQLTRHLAKRLAPTITVNAVAPGPFESKMMAATLDAFGDQIIASAPLKRIGRPDDMAGVTLFLASRAGSYVTGAVIPVDGGIATLR